MAAIQVNSDIEKEYPAQFFSLNPGGKTPPVDTTLVLIGFPHDISRLTFDDRRVVFTSVEWTMVHPNQTNLSKFDPDLHFLAPYETNEDYPDAGPHGLSGSGVWMPERVPAPTVWYPKIELAGVTIGYYRPSRLLQFVRRESSNAFCKKTLVKHRQSINRSSIRAWDQVPVYIHRHLDRPVPN